MMDYEIYKATEGRKTYLVFPYRQLVTYKAGIGFGKDNAVKQAFKQAKKYFKVSEDKMECEVGYAHDDDLWFDYKPRGAHMVIIFYTGKRRAS